MNNIDMALKTLMEFAMAKNETDRETARERLMAVYTCHTAGKKDPEVLIFRVLMDIGAPDHLIGYPYVVRAVQMLIEEPALINSVIGLYESLGREFHTSPSRVECSIRRLVEITWTRAEWGKLDKYFGNISDPNKGKPTNGEFLARLANIIRLQLRS